MIRDFDSAYMDFNVQRDYPAAAQDEPSMDGVQLAAGPSPVVSDAGAAFGVYPGMGKRSQKSTIGERMITGAPDFTAGALREGTAAGLGFGGDMQKIGRFIGALATDNEGGTLMEKIGRAGKAMEGPTLLPSSEEVSKEGFTIPGTDITIPLPPAVPPGTSALGLTPEERQSAAEAGGVVGEMVGDPFLLAKGGQLAVKGAMATGKALAPTAGEMAIKSMEKLGTPVQMNIVPDVKVFEEPIKVPPSIPTLSGSISNAITNWSSLAPEAKVQKSQEASVSLAKWLGTDNKTGKTKSLLTTNGKLLKTEKGVEGGEPIELPDGRNVESAGLALSPAFKEGKFTTCPNSASCAGDCLGKTSGGYFFMGGGADLEALKGPRLRSFHLTQAFMRDPENFGIKLNDEITALKVKAAKNGNHLAIRLNVLSDINPKVYEQIIKSNPDVTFYDYTKNNTNPIAPNHHYTYSSTGVTQPAGYNGLKETITNDNQNWKQMRKRLDTGSNVAMAFSNKTILPERVIDEETGKIYKVIDGDTYDFRPLDTQAEGADGVIVGLRNKAQTRKEISSAQDSNGFFVYFDPQIQKVKGKIVKDETGQPVYSNRDVTIAKQGTGQITLTNDYKPLGDK